jgi:multidrug efflux system outer membrane protein
MNKFSSLKILLLAAFAPAAVLFVLAQAGCTMIPKYHQPAANISTNWPSVPGYAQIKTAPAALPAADIGWSEFFQDPRLRQIIEIALTNNANLQVAVYNVQQSRAAFHIQQDALIPTIDVNGSASKTRTPNFFGGGGSNGAPSAIVYNEFAANLGITSYEVDLFGRVRSLRRNALETYFASDAARKSAQIALVANVATAYLDAEEGAQQLAIARETVKAAQQSFDLTKQSFDAGVSSQFDLNTASTQLQNALVTESTYAQQLAQANDELAFLLGEPVPPDLAPSPYFDAKICLSDIPTGLPSDLLEQRPDVIEAEHQLKAANANIGAARAAFFPTIYLTGNAGYASASLQNLFEPASAAWNISPTIVWPIFSGGTLYHGLQEVKAAQRAQAANYRNTVQNAFREVADALAARETVEVQLAGDEALVKADQQSYDLTKAGFDNGVNSALDLNVTLETLDSARLTLAQAQYLRLVSLINLYQALGGGWTEDTVQPQQSARE